MIRFTSQQRDRLLAHLAGEQPIVASELRSIESLVAKGLIKTIPRHQRPRRSTLTPAGRKVALQLQAEAII